MFTLHYNAELLVTGVTYPEVATFYASIAPAQQVLLAEKGNGRGRIKINLHRRRQERKQLKPFKGNE